LPTSWYRQKLLGFAQRCSASARSFTAPIDATATARSEPVASPLPIQRFRPTPASQSSFAARAS
jgi:hypothetical protein